MELIDINSTLIRADKIIGFSELRYIKLKESALDWCWGFKIYTNVEITIKLKYNTHSDKAMANIERNIIIDQWKQYLRKEANANNRTTLRH